MVDKLTNAEIEEVLQIHTDSYIDNYSEWKFALKAVNELISTQFNIDGDYFTYDTFCLEFNKTIKEYLTSDMMADVNMFTEDYILELLIERTGEVINSTKIED